MKYAAPLAIALIVLFPSCATQSTTGVEGTPAPAQEPAPAPSSNTGITPKGAYRGAQQAAGAVNMARTFGSLF